PGPALGAAGRRSLSSDTARLPQDVRVAKSGRARVDARGCDWERPTYLPPGVPFSLRMVVSSSLSLTYPASKTACLLEVRLASAVPAAFRKGTPRAALTQGVS